MSHADLDTDELVSRVQAGESNAVDALLGRHRQRLARMIQVRLDPRVRARVDPSDVVQETLTVASRKLPQYLASQPIAFYPWLRQIAWEQLIHLHDRHIRAAGRSVTKENQGRIMMSDHSSITLAKLFIADATSPSDCAVRQEQSQQVRSALAKMSSTDQEILMQRYLEQLSSKEIAAVFGISEGAVNLRHMRALERLRSLLNSTHEEG